MRANQLCLWFACVAYALLCALRRIALKHTQFPKFNCATVRVKPDRDCEVVLLEEPQRLDLVVQRVDLGAK